MVSGEAAPDNTIAAACRKPSSESMSAPRRNLELKARHADLAAARAAALRLGARPAGIEAQTDTYFRVPHGRLKLRVIDDAFAVLIWYERPDGVTARLSAYHLVPVPDPLALKTALSGALGVRGDVRKRREILLWYNVRIHLDDVAGLGTFVEFEAVLGPEDDERTAVECLDELCRQLAIQPAERIGSCYADMLGLA
jgi:predicted adenylyl cyclase CyaB